MGNQCDHWNQAFVKENIIYFRYFLVCRFKHRRKRLREMRGDRISAYNRTSCRMRYNSNVFISQLILQTMV